ncbi:replicative DNA helicase [Neomicrococcus aestuarii]|uniref:DNA 5'-3' helicase n=1 Tax=Neomicrococcus aestuarii TaxID=556325 RepID=A0A7W8TV89_9MICC|nr:DnaB-like helicase C-terminal domain-containing protein [Neomicrococcus aestuarii]MBB5513449.1 replicative DNA helicase [Neomicrococcus aestuarii]
MSDIEQAELSVIGSLILSGGRVLDELDFSPSDYRQPVYEQIHRVVADMKNLGKPIDVLTVGNELTLAGVKVKPGLLHEAAQSTPTVASAEYYAGIVSDAATLRRVSTAAGQIRQMVEDGGDADAIVEAARSIIDGTQSTVRTSRVEFIGETIGDTIAYLESETHDIPTPWGSLNRIMNGLKPGALYVVGARPSVGKSVVGLQLARELSKHGSVAFVSLEMSKNDVNIRLMSAELSLSMEVLMRKTLAPQHWALVSEWRHARQSLPIGVLDNAGASITDIKRFVRNVHRRKPLAGVVIDYLQLMNQAPGDRRPRHEYVAEMSRALKVMAMELNVPVIALSQLNRGSESREDRRPRISDLRESGAVEQDADVVILLHREIDGDKKYEIQMLVAKNRHGPTGGASMDFVGHYARIEDKI